MSSSIIPSLDNLIKTAVYGDKHNVIVIWGELGLGKTTFMLRLMLWSILLFKCKFKRHSKETLDSFHARVCPNSKGMCEHWQQAIDNVDFTFWEIKTRIKNAVMNNYRLAMIQWDDLGVYFHRSNIMYMHPEVKDFFSKYNFIRPYVANLVITVPDINFVPEQLLAFCTGDIWINQRGFGDFDRSKLRRSFWGRKRSWTKHYDGYDVTWNEIPFNIYREYEKIRHRHAKEAFQKPEEIFVTTMPRATQPFTEEESLF